MLTMKLGEVYKRDRDEGEWDDQDYRVYLVRDGENVFYVGTRHRLINHIAVDSAEVPNKFGWFVINNAPASWEWQTELYTFADCLPLIEKHENEHAAKKFREMVENDAFYPDPDRDAIRALTLEFRPAFNRNHNPDPMPIPAHYKDWDDHEKVSAEKMRAAMNKLPSLAQLAEEARKEQDSKE